MSFKLCLFTFCFVIVRAEISELVDQSYVDYLKNSPRAQPQVQLKFDKNSDFISDYNFALAKSDLELAADLVFAFVKFSAIQKGQSEAASNFLAAKFSFEIYSDLRRVHGTPLSENEIKAKVMKFNEFWGKLLTEEIKGLAVTTVDDSVLKGILKIGSTEKLDVNVKLSKYPNRALRVIQNYKYHEMF